MSIQRWNMRAVISTVDIEKSPSGMYVKYEDYAKELSTLKAQCDKLLAIAEIVAHFEVQPYAGARYECIFCGTMNDEHDKNCLSMMARAAIANAEARPCD